LCGYDIQIPHFANRVLRLKSAPFEVTQQDQVKVLYAEGMPQEGDPDTKGHLYIQFEVRLPQSGELDDDTRNKIADLLQKKGKSTVFQYTAKSNETAETVKAHPVLKKPKPTPASSSKHRQQSHQGGEEENVECRSM